MTTTPPAAAAAADLTDTAYWERVWQGKGDRSWADLRWIFRHAAWAALDRVLARRLPRAGRLLEVGCASGKWLVYFHRRFGLGVTGCDYSETGCQMARRALDAAGVPGTVVQQDLFALAPGGYDVVFSIGLIEHFTDAPGVLARLAGAVEPGGVVVTVVPNLSGLSGAYHRWLKPETFQTHRVVTAGQLGQWHRDLGLQDVEVGAIGSVVPFRFPRDTIRRRAPRFYRIFWSAFLGPLTWTSNRACLLMLRRLGWRPESPAFSPYLYAVATRPRPWPASGTGAGR
jgi:2-polyprenyl-6-hydroxyphenyl methylase/3-demethylubiquinone-9 3-methyltransferase